MGEERSNGVDGAIRLLQAIASAGGAVRTAALIAATGLPRASLFRMAKTLAAEGVLELSRGEIRVGPSGKAVLAAHAARMASEDEARAQRLPNQLRPVHRLDTASAALPVPLS